jgi:transcriptional regulator with XRE-family HTH domain
VRNGTLAKRLGRILAIERQKAHMTQDTLARRAGVARQQVSRFETGATEATTRLVETLFGTLGLQLRLDVEQIDSELDEEIAKARKDGPELLERTLANWAFHWRMTDKPFPVVIDGPFAAQLQGVPILAKGLDIIMKERDADLLTYWLRRMNGPRRWDERWREYRNYDSNARNPGPMRWHTGFVELAVKVADELPETVPIRCGEQTLAVRPVHEVAEDYSDVRRVIARDRRRSQEITDD